MKLSSSMEDYLEAIWVECDKKKVVRVKNIAQFLDVKTSSVIGAIKVLSDKGLVIHERYGYIELTSEGVNLAKEIYKKHQTLLKFLSTILGLNPEIAKEDACKIEHCIHKKTFNKLTKFIEFIESYTKLKDSFVSQFNDFVKSNRTRN